MLAAVFKSQFLESGHAGEQTQVESDFGPKQMQFHILMT
jgi:hypothetical protein